MMNKVLLLALCIFLCKNVWSEKNVVCYYGTWATYRHGNGHFNIEHIHSKLCTHLIYSFFGVNDDGSIRVLDPYLDLEANWGRGFIAKVNALKADNPRLKTIAAVGGWNEGSLGFSTVARDSRRRARFAENVVEFCLEHGFNGLDLDWEYPSQRDGEPLLDKENHLLLLKEISEKFIPKGLLLTAAVASAEFSASLSYDIANMHKYLDFINVMAYDFHGAWDEVIGMNAPMYASPADETEKEKQLNVNASINYWLRNGTPKEKIMLGIPLYGRAFTLADKSRFTVGSPHTGPALAGAYTQSAGMLGFNEICEKLMSTEWSHYWQAEQLSPYAIFNDQWIGYDDIKSVSIKSHYAMDAGLGGAMVWSIDTDDFRGICGNGKYPLLTAINGIVRGDKVDQVASTEATIRTSCSTANSMEIDSATATADTTTEVATQFSSETNAMLDTATTSDNGNQSDCMRNGIFRDPKDCSKFFVCHENRIFHFECSKGLVFDLLIAGCNWKSVVEC